MADKENKVAKDSKVEKATTEESKAADKVAKAAKGNKSDKAGLTTRAGKGAKRFFKDFKGECKKIVWPDAKTILKSTGVVLLVVAIVTVAVFVVDFGLERGISGLKGIARSQTDAVVATATDATEADEDAVEETEEAEAEETTEAEASQAEATEE